MLHRDITYTYTNLKGEEVTETKDFWFNISETEIIDLEVEFKGIVDFFEQMIKEEDHQKLYDMFKRLIKMSYGIPADDGREFEKSEELANKFVQSAAHNALIVEFMTSEQVVADFVLGVFPKKFAKAAEKEVNALVQNQTQAQETNTPAS